MLSRLRFVPLCIPFVQEFSHAQKARSESDSFLIELQTSQGKRAYGEALVRPYVTGESRAVVSACLRDIVVPRLRHFPWDLLSERPTLRGSFPAFQTALDSLCQDLPDGPLAWNGLRCALELALLNLWLDQHGLSLAELLPAKRKEVIYSGILSATDLEKTLRSARNFAQLGIYDLKLKVSGQSDIAIIHALLAQGGERLRLRLDANSAFDLAGAMAFVSELEGLPILAIEQPLLRGDVAQLATLQAHTDLPLMVDESLLTLADAESLIAARACRVFNVRLAKNGGLGPSLRLADLAAEAGLALQVGAMVGETALLSAVGRQFSAHCPEVLSTEGSFGSLLLKQDLSRQSIRFGFGGKAPALKGPGFGIELLPERLELFCVREEAWEMSL